MDGLIAYALAKNYTDKVGQDIISAGFKVQVEDNRSILNRQGEEKVLYLLPKEYGSSQDGYDEFVYANNTWEWVGKTDVSLDYELLENKPQINNNDLIGNVSFSNEFNIEALEDLLNIEIATIDGNKVHNIPLTSLANTFSDGLFLEIAQNDLNDYGKDLNYWGYLNSRNHISGEGNICVRIINPSLFRHLPEYVYTNNLNCTVLSCSTYNSACGFQLVFTRDIVNSNKTKIFARYRASSYPFTASWQPWQELTGGGSQIVSGVVNANGTITFTDSDGNSFTTSGSNLVISGNEQISMGYDNGGFYFLFDDGQEEVNNGTD